MAVIEQRDPNAWFKLPNWNFAHRLDVNGTHTLCRRSVLGLRRAAEPLPLAEEHDERCPTCTSVLSEGAL